MRMKRWFVTAVLCGATVALVGCADVCTRLGWASEGLKTKGQPCGSTGNLNFSVDKCQQGLSKCSPDDVKSLNQVADCLDRIPQCQSGGALGWGLQIAGCVTAYPVSANCAVAVY